MAGKWGRPVLNENLLTRLGAKGKLFFISSIVENKEEEET
jgi:hypothetical protein